MTAQTKLQAVSTAATEFKSETLHQSHLRQAELESLRDQLADLRSGNHASSDNSFELEGWLPNEGTIPDFLIRYENGQSIQAPFVQEVPGATHILGTTGKDGDPIYSHELYVQPVIAIDYVPTTLPEWLPRIISSDSVAYANFVEEVRRLGDWALTAEIERYRGHDVRVQTLSAQISALQQEEINILQQARLSHFRLARADAGTRLASLEALDHDFQAGFPDGSPRPFPRRCKNKGQGRPFVK
jgi:hypothetical protein